MEAKDLMIGDWVMQTDPLHNGEPAKVTEIKNIRLLDGSDCYLICSEDADMGVDIIAPIPLTAEILRKNGFIRTPLEQWEIDVDELGGCNFLFILDETYDDDGFFLNANGVLVKLIHHVHELQHALRLCDIKKEVVL